MIKAKIQVEVLSDRNSRGRERPWRYHKVMNEYLAMAYDDIDERTAERLRGCAPRLTFVSVDGQKKLKGAWFCRVRLCPMCTWRRSLKVGSQMRKVMAAIASSDMPLRYIFLTLTVKNCHGKDLSSEITKMLTAFNLLTKQTAFKKISEGWFRGLEVTHNTDTSSKDYDTFHPHIHLMIAVKPTYYSGRHYLKQEKWTAMWKQALRCDYTPIVDVRTVKGDTTAAVAEAAKYAAKVKDYIIPDDWDLTVDTVRTLDKAFRARKFIAFGGVIREWHKKLNLDDADTGDLIHTDPDEAGVNTDGHPTYSYAWNTGYIQYTREQPYGPVGRV